MRIVLALLTAVLCAQTPEQLRLSQQGKQLMAAGRFSEAVPVYQTLTRQAPGNPGLQFNLGIALHIAGRDPEAVAVLEPVTKPLPPAFPALIPLGTSPIAPLTAAPAIAAPHKALLEAPPGTGGPDHPGLRLSARERRGGAKGGRGVGVPAGRWGGRSGGPSRPRPFLPA